MPLSLALVDHYLNQTMEGTAPMRMEYFDPKSKGIACQGDVVLMPLPKGYAINKSREIKRGKDGTIVLAEGEVTGHHHVIGLIQPGCTC